MVTFGAWDRIRNKIRPLSKYTTHMLSFPSIQIVWSWAIKCSVKSHVTKPSTKCYFKELLFMQVLAHDKIE
jgi:hypothetical protein